ncbi:3-dehydroquinate synthase [Lederbergia graminis]|uniref:3-dehydroquinate synthase n=1 Tax=Lederbergia graminis TaxID=735518 RepID=A0ABW0LD47_9BACI
MVEITVETPSKKYPVFIGNSALTELSNHLQQRNYTKLLVITDEKVGELHLNTLKDVLPKNDDVFFFQVPTGEKAKQFSVYEQCLTFALENGLDRKSCIIAFGGGAVGDLAGFTAATYMRGIPFIQVPTTILAHDSAVGGKTGINHPLGKNMIGSFHQPEAVFYYTTFLKTLPAHEIRSGFAEAVKHSLIADRDFYYYLLENIQDLQQVDEEKLNYILKKGIEIKAAVVAEDERESGLRAILNFGHTLGHVIEATAGYGKVTHGEAVMTGMVYALYLSEEVLGLQFDIETFKKWIEKLGYQSQLPKDFNFELGLAGMKRDKKSYANKPRFVLLEDIGKPVIQEISEDVLRSVFSSFSIN